MAKKILLASGCSYTDTHYRSNDPTIKRDWEMWPELMAKELGLECVNKGQSGAGADHIFDTILEGLSTYGDRVDTVAILWSTSDRLPFFNFTLNPIVECNTINGNYDPFPWMDDIGVGKISQKYFKSDHFLSTKAYKSMILNPIRKMFAMTACTIKRVRIKATLSDSRSQGVAFSPKAFAQIRHIIISMNKAKRQTYCWLGKSTTP